MALENSVNCGTLSSLFSDSRIHQLLETINFSSKGLLDDRLARWHLTNDLANLTMYVELPDYLSTFLHLMNAFAKLHALSLSCWSCLPGRNITQQSPNSAICYVIGPEFTEKVFI